MQSLLEKLEKLRLVITEIMDEIHNQNQEDRPVESKFSPKPEQGPVKLWDANGVYPNNLDVAVQQQCRHNMVYDFQAFKHTRSKCGIGLDE